jgi:hypothetical protein
MMEHTWQEKKYQEESKQWHPEPPAHAKFLCATLDWENRRAPVPPNSGSKPALGDIQQTNRGANKCHMVFTQPPLG